MTDKPRILVNYFTSMPDMLTGISVYTFQILQALARRASLDLVMMTNWSLDALPPAIRGGDITLLHKATPRSEKLQFAHTAFLAATTARHIGADVVFTPHPWGAPVGGKARVMVMHDLYRETNPDLHRWDRRWTWKAAISLAAAGATRIVCVSDATRHDFCRLHPGQADKAVTIHEASAVADVVPDAGPFVGISYALVVANATRNKNLERLIEALVLLRRQGLAPRVYWVGRDDYGGLTAALAQHPELDNFVALGRVDDARLAGLYAGARAYITPSLIEGFCIPILEAQRFGVPVLCSDIPVLREVAGDGALTFDPQRPQDMADAFQRLWLDDDLQRRLSQRARANAARFSWDKAAAETEQLFRDCLAPADRRQAAGRSPASAVRTETGRS